MVLTPCHVTLAHCIEPYVEPLEGRQYDYELLNQSKFWLRIFRIILYSPHTTHSRCEEGKNMNELNKQSLMIELNSADLSDLKVFDLANFVD